MTTARSTSPDVASIMQVFADVIGEHLEGIRVSQQDSVRAAALLVADKVVADELIYVYGPGGHSNLAAQEVFFRAGGLVNVSAILDSGTMLADGALRSMNVERTPGYGRVVIDDNGLDHGDLMILVNAYGINATLIEAALVCRERGVTLIGVSSREHADQIPAGHPARHRSGQNLHDVVDVHVDTQVPVGDAVLAIGGVSDEVAAISTFANAYAMHSIMACAVAEVGARGVEPTIWRSGNAPDGDARNSRFIDRFRSRVRWL